MFIIKGQFENNHFVLTRIRMSTSNPQRLPRWGPLNSIGIIEMLYTGTNATRNTQGNDV